MFQKDYILRLIEEISKVLEKALKLKNNNDFDSAKQVLNNAYENLLKIKKQDFLHIPNQKLIELLQNTFDMDIKKIELLSKLLTEDANLETDYASKIKLSEKALFLLEHISETDKTFSFERINQIKQLKDNLSNSLQ